jgi:peptidoglycan/LPS O-acetylase OafA/YrhL
MRNVIGPADRYAGLEDAGAAQPQSRMSGLDGLRALAVIAVMLFHADVSWAGGGYLGVDLFFVISGFLITGLLAGEFDRTGKLSLLDFYERRARRLLPASWLMTAAVIVAAAFFAQDALHRLRGDAIASFFYVTNWELIVAGRSYFEEIGRQPLLLHLWSLAIEEQFYIFWAPVILFVMPRAGRRGLIASVLAILSIAWMATLAARMGYPGSGDPSRLYFGTDTHGFVLLIGAVMGLVYRPRRFARVLSPPDNEGVFILGCAALAATIGTFIFLGEATAWLYPWGFLLSALTSAALIAAATVPGSYFGRWIDNAPMRWIGERSYGIYLWHWPIFMLTRPDLDLSWPAPAIFMLRMALTIGIAALSYRFVETPIREGSLGRMWASLRARRGSADILRAGFLASGVIATVAACAIILSLAPRETPPPDVAAAIGLNAAVKSSVVHPRVTAKIPIVKLSATLTGPFTGNDLTAVGDSVLLGSSRVLARELPGAKVYATVGWQAANVLAQLQALHDANALTPVVLIHLGTNGYITEAQLRAMLDLVADREHVILVNTHVPRRWMDANNDLIDRVAGDYRNVTVMDWRSISADHRNYFVSDDVHLTVAGQKVFVNAIADAGDLVIVPQPEPRKPERKVTIAQPILPTSPEDLSATLVRFAKPVAPDSYWRMMARCETGTNWQNGGRFSGGLGIYTGSWKAWGGLDFADVPADATPEQQITVANRISTQGWTRPDGSVQRAVGFSGWGCRRTIGQPMLLKFTPDSLLAQQYHWQQVGEAVRELQLVLGVPVNGVYGKLTSEAHIALLRQKGLPESLAASAP